MHFICGSNADCATCERLLDEEKNFLSLGDFVNFKGLVYILRKIWITNLGLPQIPMAK